MLYDENKHIEGNMTSGLKVVSGSINSPNCLNDGATWYATWIKKTNVILVVVDKYERPASTANCNIITGTNTKDVKLNYCTLIQQQRPRGRGYCQTVRLSNKHQLDKERKQFHRSWKQMGGGGASFVNRFDGECWGTGNVVCMDKSALNFDPLGLVHDLSKCKYPPPPPPSIPPIITESFIGCVAGDQSDGMMTPGHASCSSIGTTFSTITALLITITVLIAVGLFVNRNAYVIVMSSPMFCLLITVGGVCGLSYVFTLIGKPTNSTCIAQTWIAGIGFVLIIGPLLAKTWRMHKVFNNPDLKRIQLSNMHLLRGIGGFMFLQLLLLFSWNVFNTPIVIG